MKTAGLRRRTRRSGTRTRHQTRIWRRSGSAAVEFAVVAPIMFMLVLGMFELGRAMSIQQVLTNAAREGAREAILIGSTTESVTDIVNNYTDAANIVLDASQPEIEPADFATESEAGDMITVTVSVDVSALSMFGTKWMGETFQLSASSTMRKEGYE